MALVRPTVSDIDGRLKIPPAPGKWPQTVRLQFGRCAAGAGLSRLRLGGLLSSSNRFFNCCFTFGCASAAAGSSIAGQAGSVGASVAAGAGAGASVVTASLTGTGCCAGLLAATSSRPVQVPKSGRLRWLIQSVKTFGFSFFLVPFTFWVRLGCHQP
jgi:hypothetical protein